MASGDSLLIFDAMANQPPDADFATLDTILVASADEPDDVIPVLDFDPGATDEVAEFASFFPEHYDGGGLTLVIFWVSEATSGDVIWTLAVKALADSEPLLTTTFAAPNTTTTGTDGTARDINTTVITFTNGADMASLVAGNYARFRLTRNSSAGGDTMNSNDAEFISMHVKET